MEAVKQGSACVGLKSKKFAVLAALKRASSELAEPQPKVFKNHKYVYGEPKEVERLVGQIADKSQVHTQKYGRRPYGVGLLVAGYDRGGAHLLETSPSGDSYSYKAFAIGARSQSAKTYLEKHFESFADADRTALLNHALIALRDTVSSKDESGLTARNTSLAIVGHETPFTLIEGDALKALLDALEGGTGGKQAGDDDDDDLLGEPKAAGAPRTNENV